MAVRVNEVNQVTQVPDAQKTQAGDGSFKFTLASAITDLTHWMMFRNLLGLLLSAILTLISNIDRFLLMRNHFLE